MNAQDKPAFKDLITQALAFYRQDVSGFTLTVWWQACAPFSMEQVHKAFTAHAIDAERGRFPPMPADIVRQLQGTQTDRSLIAWGKVLDAMQRVGAYSSVVFDDGAIHAAIEDMGGWSKVCRSTMDELPFVQKRFTEAHRAYSARPGISFPAKLLGEHEVANRMQGKRVAPPMLVGDPAKAKEVMALGLEGPKTQIVQDVERLEALTEDDRIRIAFGEAA